MRRRRRFAAIEHIAEQTELVRSEVTGNPDSDRDPDDHAKSAFEKKPARIPDHRLEHLSVRESFAEESRKVFEPDSAHAIGAFSCWSG